MIRAEPYTKLELFLVKFEGENIKTSQNQKIETNSLTVWICCKILVLVKGPMLYYHWTTWEGK